MTRLAFPFGPAASGRTATVVYGDGDQVRQMLELLVFTMASERPMNPSLGSPIRQMVFTAGAGPAAIALQAALQAAIGQWLGHVLELQDLAVTFSEVDAKLEVDILYEVRATRSGDRLTVTKALA